MIKKDSVYAVYSERSKILKLFNENSYKEEYRCVKGNVYINHENKEIRLYNFRKSDLLNEEKVEIISGILEELVLLPKSFISKENEIGNVGEYTLMVGGYLLNGEFKETYKKYPSIVTDLIDNTKHYSDESKKIEFYRNVIKKFYVKNKRRLGKETVILNIENTSIIKGYIEYLNVAKLLYIYLKDKNIKFKLELHNKFFGNKRKILILPI